MASHARPANCGRTAVAAATFRTIPTVGAKGLTVKGFEFADDSGLQAGEIGFQERCIYRHLGGL